MRGKKDEEEEEKNVWHFTMFISGILLSMTMRQRCLTVRHRDNNKNDNCSVRQRSHWLTLVSTNSDTKNSYEWNRTEEENRSEREREMSKAHLTKANVNRKLLSTNQRTIMHIHWEIHTCHRSIDWDLFLFDEEKKRGWHWEKKKTRINNQQEWVIYIRLLLIFLLIAEMRREKKRERVIDRLVGLFPRYLWFLCKWLSVLISCFLICHSRQRLFPT